jgi:hypothetical protein
MKIYEIISEAPSLPPGYTTTPGGIAVPQSATTPTTASASTPPYTPSNSIPSKKVGIFGRTAPSKPSKTTPTSTGSSPGQDIGKWVNERQKKWRANKTRAQRVERVWMGKYGFFLTSLMKVLGVGIALTELYVDLEGLDEDFQNNQLNKKQVESAREFLFGVFSAQILVPAVARRIAGAKTILLIVRIIKNLAGAAAGGISAGATIAAAVASEAFFIWLQAWLGSDAGKDWIANTFLMGIVKTMGKIPEGAWSSLTSYYENSEEAKKTKKAELAKKDPAKAAQRDAEDQAAADREKQIAANEKYIGGVRVTDIEGNLIPGIENNIRVKAAIERDLAAGKPNPLDALK